MSMVPRRHFRVYGGPKGGTVTAVPHRATSYSFFFRSNRVAHRFHYVLVSTPDGGNAFVPEEDECLKQAYRNRAGELGDRETETLAAEIQRRGLKV